MEHMKPLTLITPDQYRAGQYAKLQRNGQILTCLHGTNVSGLDLEYITQDSETGEWYAHIEGIERPMLLDENHRIGVEVNAETVYGQARALKSEDRLMYSDEYLTISYVPTAPCIITVPLPSTIDGETVPYTHVASIEHIGKERYTVHVFRPGQWLHHLNALYESAQQRIRAIAEENAEREAREYALKFAPIDDAALFEAVSNG